MLEGINDLGFDPTLPVERVIDGLRRAVRRLQAVRRDRRRPRLNVIVGTLTPSGGATLPNYASAETDRRRQEINRLIRTSGIGDGGIDFDRALRSRRPLAAGPHL